MTHQGMTKNKFLMTEEEDSLRHSMFGLRHSLVRHSWAIEFISSASPPLRPPSWTGRS